MVRRNSEVTHGMDSVQRDRLPVPSVRDKQTLGQWWTMHIVIPIGALFLYARTMQEEVKGQ